MRLHLAFFFTACLGIAAAFPESAETAQQYQPSRQHPAHPKDGAVCPKVMIISMFTPEAEAWHNIKEFDLLARNITVSGLSPLFPAVHCTKSGDVCQVVTGEGEINAAATIASLVVSPVFDLRKTYFLVAGIAGISPDQGTISDVTFARFAIQVALQHEFDAREIPTNFSTGYFPQGSDNPKQYPQDIYGTEVFEFSAHLRDRAVALAQRARLEDSQASRDYRSRYPAGTAARREPRAHGCDSATSDAYFSGALLGQAFANYTRLVSNGTAVYCTTSQEDNATAEGLLRAARLGLLDFARVVVMRTASDFDRPYPGASDLQNLVYFDQGAVDPSLRNLYLAGREFVGDVLRQWSAEYERGLPVTNYVGDILGSLGGQKYRPAFGLPSRFVSGGQQQQKRRRRAGWQAKMRSLEKPGR